MHSASSESSKPNIDAAGSDHDTQPRCSHGFLGKGERRDLLFDSQNGHYLVSWGTETLFYEERVMVLGLNVSPVCCRTSAANCGSSIVALLLWCCESNLQCLCSRSVRSAWPGVIRHCAVQLIQVGNLLTESRLLPIWVAICLEDSGWCCF